MTEQILMSREEYEENQKAFSELAKRYKDLESSKDYNVITRERLTISYFGKTASIPYMVISEAVTLKWLANEYEEQRNILLEKIRLLEEKRIELEKRKWWQLLFKKL